MGSELWLALLKHRIAITVSGSAMIAIAVIGRIEIGDGIATTTGIAVAAMIGTIVMTAMIAMVGTGTMVATTMPLRLS